MRDAVQLLREKRDFVMGKVTGENCSLKKGVRTMQALNLRRPFREPAGDDIPLRMLCKDSECRRFRMHGAARIGCVSYI
ncbi:hypothetical protein A2G96_13195 [Cupriavidus nantongensis]|uniref:Uncharacterized protein n=1 Tax=Cupriavidus nantongensis TaxID=1796606 RepID=A0A142JKK9_9BURK|nr:hypothetical protein A2G96_13195 [Cupriavidus nantongensis]